MIVFKSIQISGYFGLLYSFIPYISDEKKPGRFLLLPVCREDEVKET